jgi:inorganic pyrophosphatase/exopolyphosphatase
MAARALKNTMHHMVPEPCKLFARGTGASAADLTVLTAGAGSAGVTSIKYNSATGKLKVTLEDKWNALLMVSAVVIDTTTPDDWEVVVEAEDVAGAKTISLAVFKGGTLADLTTDEQLLLEITVCNSARPR